MFIHLYKIYESIKNLEIIYLIRDVYIILYKEPL